MVTVFNEDLVQNTLQLTQQMREAGINTDLYSSPTVKLDKQLKYADRKGIPYVIILGPEEVNQNKLKLKNMQTQEQMTLTLEELVQKLK